MNRTQKAELIDELKQSLSKAASLIVTDYRGVSVEEANGLRSEIREADCFYRVIKNTLLKRAVSGTELEGIADLFTGPTAIAYSYEDPVVPAKIVDKFADDLDHLEVKGGFLDGKVLSPDSVKQLAKMKGKDELRAQFLATLNAPAEQFVRLLAAAPQNFLYLLQARKRTQEEA